jgi:NADPH-dependent 2,4-dienoyl-CoA reductase/sulfur reductase-like enzyme
MCDPNYTFDVVIVGAGPGGIAAAVTLVEAGHRLALIDDAPFAGGQIWRNRGEKHKGKVARGWIDRLNTSSSRVTWLRQSRVIANPGEGVLLADTPDGPRKLTYAVLVLATGARELFLPFPGWTLPGVVGAGGIQALVKQGLPVKGKRIVVAGTGPLLLAVADLMKSQGAIVPLILEQTPGGKLNRFALSLLRSPSKLLAGVAIRSRLLGTAYAADSYPTAATPAGDALCVQYRRRKNDATVECDYLACGFNLVPNTELPQLLGCALQPDGFVRVDERMRTSAANVYAIGEVTGVGGVEKAVLEGRLAAHVIAGDDAAAALLVPHRAKAMAFVRRLEAAFSLRPELTKLAKSDTIICRCEDVPLSSIEHAFSGRDAKLQSRCGMGPCQGRVCGPAMQRLFNTEPPLVRAPVFATSVGVLALTPHPLSAAGARLESNFLSGKIRQAVFDGDAGGSGRLGAVARDE